jgi:methionyl aminopeptidase
MVNLGKFEVSIDERDDWTVTTVDGSLSAQFEHTLVATKNGCEILTQRPKPLRASENVVTYALA